MTSTPPDLIILGAGPAGCALAIRVAMRGGRATVFDDDRRPPLLVGESLIPAVVQHFRELGVEEQVKAVSSFKPGAAFFSTTGEKIHFNFRSVEKILPGYAYNSPRPALDNILRERAEGLGATFVKGHAGLEVYNDRFGERTVRLDAESCRVAGLSPSDEQPLIVDATGRNRLIARTLQIPSTRGKRNDVAYFAHYEDFPHDEVSEGNIIISVLKAGWSWRIPLPGRLSVGVVISKDHAATLGKTPEERLANAIASEPLLCERGKNAKSVTNVMTYTNYQLLAERGHGPGWILLGDAFGFVDPMLSPGLFMSLEGARILDETVLQRFPKAGPAANEALERYSHLVRDWHHSWARLVDYFYDGNIFRAYLGGKQLCANHAGGSFMRKIDTFASYQIAAMASGGKTRSRFSQWFLKTLCRHIVKDVPPAEHFAVHNVVQA
jgi:flavin-dependent dehydrogenase